MGDKLIRAYLSELDAALAVVPGSLGARAAIVAEIGDGLTDAVTDHLDRGCPPAEAEQRVIDEFGGAALVAAQFVPVLAAAQVHRCALALLRTGPLVGALWLATALLRPPITSHVTVTAAVMVATALVIAVPCIVFAVTVTGRGIRWWTVPPRHAAAAALIAAGGAVVGDLVLLIALGTQVPMLLAEPSRTGLGIVLAGLAALASLIRLALTTRGTMRLRRSRAALGTV
jgi:hypothetical protein